jgi:hypothetical protein
MCFFRKNAILVQLIGVDDQEDDEELHWFQERLGSVSILFLPISAINSVGQSIV